MRLLLPTVSLPHDLIHLLKMNISPNMSGEEHPAVKAIGENKPLFMILERSLKDLKEKKIGLGKLFNGLGWSNFKDRWSVLYIHKSLYGSFPDELDLDLAEDIKKLDVRFSRLQLLGNSRIYLLGLYLKMINLEHKKLNADAEDDYWVIPETLDQIFVSHAFKSDKADWLVLSMWQFLHFLGAEKILQVKDEGKPYEMLFAYLTEPQRYQFINNLLAYGASINDSEIFVSKKV
jgi:hypothetical protein